MESSHYKSHLVCFRIFLLLTINLVHFVNAQQTGALTMDVISEKPTSNNDFPIVSLQQKSTNIFHDPNDYEGVIRAIGDFQADIERVTGIKPAPRQC